jgi:hypothetical protein
VTEVLGVEPTLRHLRGDKIQSGGRPSVYKTGVWALVIDEPPLTLQQKCGVLLSRLARHGLDYRSIAGVELAYIDAFIAAEDSEHRLDLGPDDLATLSARGLAVQMTVSP